MTKLRGPGTGQDLPPQSALAQNRSQTQWAQGWHCPQLLGWGQAHGLPEGLGQGGLALQTGLGCGMFGTLPHLAEKLILWVPPPTCSRHPTEPNPVPFL